MHRQQTSGLIDRKTSVRTGLDMKMRYAGILFVKIIMIARIFWAGTAQCMMLFTSADKLHTHPSVCGLAGLAKPCIGLNLRQEATSA